MPYNNVNKETPVLNDDSDVVIVNSDDYFSDELFKQLRKLKKKYLAVFVIGFNDPKLLLYNKQYVDFCFDNNINFLDFDKDTMQLDEYLKKNLSFDDDYSTFAKYYEKMQVEIDYNPWFEGMDFKGKKVVDFGCGSAPYLKELKGAEYLGIDISPEMIGLGREKYPNTNFEVGDVKSYKEKCDIAISILDVINYLPTIDDVYAMLENVYDNLNANGTFIFDVHHKAVLRLFKKYFDFEDDEEGQFIWESNVDGYQINHYFQMIDNDYIVHVEKHSQKYYDIDLLLKKLKEIGFKIQSNKVEYNHHIIVAKKGNDE